MQRISGRLRQRGDRGQTRRLQLLSGERISLAYCRFAVNCASPRHTPTIHLNFDVDIEVGN